MDPSLIGSQEVHFGLSRGSYVAVSYVPTSLIFGLTPGFWSLIWSLPRLQTTSFLVLVSSEAPESLIFGALQRHVHTTDILGNQNMIF